jgi:hypothetical protein
VVFVADQYASEILQPGEESLHFPAALVPPQRAAILRLGFLAVGLMRGNQLDPLESILSPIYKIASNKAPTPDPHASPPLAERHPPVHASAIPSVLFNAPSDRAASEPTGGCRL